MKRNEVPYVQVHRVAVGTTNPVKIEATQKVIHTYWPHAEIIAVPVPSGVADQPWGIEETVRGARQRANAALQATHADLGIGLEGGVEEVPEAGGLFLSGWAAVITREGHISYGSGGRVLLPPKLIHALRQGQELGPAMDHLSGRENTKHTVGSVGILTRGFVTRASQFAVALAYALVPLLHPSWWEGEKQNEEFTPLKKP